MDTADFSIFSNLLTCVESILVSRKISTSMEEILTWFFDKKKKKIKVSE